MPPSFSTQYSRAKSDWIAPFGYQEQHTGKQIRTALTQALSAFYGLAPEQADILCATVEKFNTASLVHDDIVDQDETRRGAPSVWVRYGADIALISGMHGYIEGLQKLGELRSMDLIEAGLRSLERLHIGQYLDIRASNGQTLPTLEDYRFIAQANTGCFFLFIVESCQILKALDAAVFDELNKLMNELAVYYRYVNDYCDINHIPHFEKKGFAPDLEGGPKSFLMILANKSLIKKKRTEEEKRQIIVDFGDTGVLANAMYLMEKSYGLMQQHFSNIQRLTLGHHSVELKAFLDEVHFLPHPSDNCYNSLVVQRDEALGAKRDSEDQRSR